MLKFLTLIVLACGAFTTVAAAGIITLSGTITQSTDDGTGPALNNSALNSIHDTEQFTVTLNFAGSITAPGTYDLTGAVLTFSDTAALAGESSFDAISLTVAANGAFDDFSLLACLITGSGCGASNQLNANFRIAAADLNAAAAGAAGLDPPHPFDLLEDDGATDIQGTITSYSYASGVNAVPEPGSIWLLGCALAIWKGAQRVLRLAAVPTTLEKTR